MKMLSKHLILSKSFRDALYSKENLFFCSIFYIFILDPKIKIVNLENYRKKSQNYYKDKYWYYYIKRLKPNIIL